MSEIDPVDGVLYRTAGEWRALKQRQRAIGEEVGCIAERAACAALCREAGCLCFAIFDAGWDTDAEIRVYNVTAGSPGNVARVLRKHDSRCPDALASRIEERSAPRAV